jgi:hypothetical protein
MQNRKEHVCKNCMSYCHLIYPLPILFLCSQINENYTLTSVLVTFLKTLTKILQEYLQSDFQFLSIKTALNVIVSA